MPFYSKFGGGSVKNFGQRVLSRSVTPTIQVLVQAGGGAGHGSPFLAGSGGTGGQRENAALAVTPGVQYTVTVGNGGSGQTNAGGTVGQASSFNTFAASGGAIVNGSGGCGGGGGVNTAGGAGNSGGYTPVEGYGGSAGGDPNLGGRGGGGGGTNAAGSSGNGGAGRASSITGTSVQRGGGGGGSGTGSYGAGGAGGGGGGGAGGVVGGPFGGGNGGTNTGGGGGGGSYSFYNGTGGNGGSGVVIIAYPSTFPVALATTGSPTYSAVSRSGFHVYTFTGTGSITF